MRVAIYIRVSTAEQAREGYSLEAQEKVLRDYCKARGYEVVEIYSDEGISGGTIIKRPGFISMMEDSQENKFDTIMVWKLTRFSRSLKDILAACEDLEKRGIYLHSYSEAFDSKTPAGRFMRGMLGLAGQFEREVLSENVALGLNQRALKGMRTCTVMLGYDVVKGGDMVINEKEAEIVRFIYKSYTERKSLLEVAALCREKGYYTKRGKDFAAQSILVILTRFSYCGFYSWHGKPIKGNFEPLIAIKDFNKVQSILKAQGKLTGRKRHKNLGFIRD